MINIWKAGIFGVVTEDALGCPVQFEERDEVARYPVTGMRGNKRSSRAWVDTENYVS